MTQRHNDQRHNDTRAAGGERRGQGVGRRAHPLQMVRVIFFGCLILTNLQLQRQHDKEGFSPSLLCHCSIFDAARRDPPPPHLVLSFSTQQGGIPFLTTWSFRFRRGEEGSPSSPLGSFVF